jgi:hypothetical protein
VEAGRSSHALDRGGCGATSRRGAVVTLLGIVRAGRYSDASGTRKISQLRRNLSVVLGESWKRDVAVEVLHALVRTIDTTPGERLDDEKRIVASFDIGCEDTRLPGRLGKPIGFSALAGKELAA